MICTTEASPKKTIQFLDLVQGIILLHATNSTVHASGSQFTLELVQASTMHHKLHSDWKQLLTYPEGSAEEDHFWR